MTADSRPLRFAYVAGEASGDRHAAALHRALVTLAGDRQVEAYGIGGSGLAGAGVKLIADSSTWGSIGVVEALRGLPKYFTGFAALKKALTASPPDALILVDFGAFNVPVAKWARKNNVGPIVYYLPPRSWDRAPNPNGHRALAALTDLIITPFEWSNKHLREAGANSHWVGHPLVDIVKPSMDGQEFDAEFGLDPAKPIIALLPGSRGFEVKYNLPMMLDAASIVSRRVPGAQFLLAAAPNLNREGLERILNEQRTRGGGSSFNVIERAGEKLKQLGRSAIDTAVPTKALVTSEGFVIGKGPEEQTPWTMLRPQTASSGPATLAIVQNQTYDCIARADLVITASGTATLEAAILKRPMIIVYKGSTLMGIEWSFRKRRLNLEFIGLPNIIAGQQVAPEFIAEHATAERVADTAVGMLIEPERLMRAKQIMTDAVVPAIGAPGAVQRAAQLIWETVGAKSNAIERSA